MFDLVPIGLILVIVAAAVIFFGWGQRVLDRMKLTDIQALALLGIMFVGFFLPEIRIATGVSLDVGGALVPLGVAIYLIATAGTSTEKSRAIVASLLTFAVVYSTDKLLPTDPFNNFRGTIAPDPILIPAIVGGLVAYLLGRSRRAAFIAGVIGVVLTDLAVVFQNFLAGVPGALVAIGGAGVFDATLFAGFLAVALAEIIGETREALRGGPAKDRPAGLLKGLEGGGPAIGREVGGPFAENQEGGEGDASPPNGGARNRSGGDADRPLPRGAALSLLALAALLVTGSTVLGPRFAGSPDEILHGALFTVQDESGRVLLQSSRWVHVGDEWIAADNRWYRIQKVEGHQATAGLLGLLDLRAELENSDNVTFAGMGGDPSLLPAAGGLPDLAAAKRDITVGIYHTHNDESYVPTNGKESVNGRGGIHRVGKTFSDVLRSKGYKVIHNENVHLPHDNGAYRRSRRTASALTSQGSDLLFDVHRDAGPSKSYATEIKGKGVTQVRLVVGQENPQRSINLKYAKELKAIADDLHPGLVKGIWFGRDAYNQDVSPRAILLELGTEQNAQPSAQRGITAFADVVDRWVARNLGKR